LQLDRDGRETKDTGGGVKSPEQGIEAITQFHSSVSRV
ncbi:unnamed protein product, partial [marine sediment metagenome]